MARYKKFDDYLKAEDRGYETPCLIWQGAHYPNGYGIYHVPGTSKAQGNSRTDGVHRFAWQREHGPLPEGIKVLHKCDVRDCANLDHLFTGSQKDNTDDAIRKGRFNPLHRGNIYDRRGERNASAKLSPEQAQSIRESSETGAVLAARYGISDSQVYRIKSGLRWKV